MSDSMLFKLIVLFMLDLVEGPLATDQLSEFLLKQDSGDYFTFRQLLDEMISSNLIKTETTYNRTLYRITSTGKNTLKYYNDHIPDDVRKDIISYLMDNEVEIKEILTVYSDFYKSTDGNYNANCQIREHNMTVVNLTLSLPTKRQAEAVCQQWKEHYSDVYAYLMDTLVR